MAWRQGNVKVPARARVDQVRAEQAEPGAREGRTSALWPKNWVRIERIESALKKTKYLVAYTTFRCRLDPIKLDPSSN
jgi:hypothetical protein